MSASLIVSLAKQGGQSWRPSSGGFLSPSSVRYTTRTGWRPRCEQAPRFDRDVAHIVHVLYGYGQDTTIVRLNGEEPFTLFHTFCPSATCSCGVAVRARTRLKRAIQSGWAAPP